MPAARQMTTAELDKLIEGVIKRSLTAPPSERDGLKKQFESLIKQKDSLIKAKDRDLVDRIKQLKSAESENLRLKRQLENNFNTQEGRRPGGQSGRRRTGTAEDAAREKAARDAAAKNPDGGKPRGNLKPGDIKKPPAGSDALDGIKKWADGVKTKTAPGVNYVKNSRLGNFVKGSASNLSKAGDAIAKTPVGKGLGAANKILGPLGAAITVGQAVQDLFGESPIEKNTKEVSEFKDGVEAALVTIITKQNRMRGMIQALAQSNSAVLASQQQLMQGLAILAQSIDAIEDYSLTTKTKVSSVNFAAIKNAADEAAIASQAVQKKINQVNFASIKNAAEKASEDSDWTRKKLAQVNFAAIKNGVDQAVAALPTNGIFRVDQAGIANAVDKKLHPLFKLIDGKLPDNGIFRVDQTGIANAVDKKLHYLFKLIDGKLPDNGIFRVDQTGIANFVKAKLDSSFSSIESKLQPINLSGVFTQLTRIEGKIPAPMNITGINSQLTSLSTQIAGVNGAIASIPSKIPAPLAPNLTPLLNAINNIRFPAPAAPDLSILTNQLSGLSTQISGVNGAIASIPSKIPSPTPTDLRPVLDAIDAVPSKIKVPEPNLTPVLKALDPIAANAADISAALSAPLFKTGMPIKAHDELLKIGQQTDSGINPTIVKSLPAMVMALSAVAYTRSGHHRLGGSFDKSVMDPAQGKTKITDMVGFQKWTFDQIDQRLGLPTKHTVIDSSGRTQTKSFQSVQDAIEEGNALNIVAGQDLEVVERYLFALTQDLQKLMQIALQTREDVDLVIDDLGCKFKETKRSHPTHISLKGPGQSGSLESLFKRGEVHYVARTWDDKADKNQKLERIGYDTQIAAMSNKFELDKTNPQLPLANSRATKGQSEELWKVFVSTLEEPPEGYVTPGNPIPDIKEIENGTTKEIPKPSNPTKKLGK
jgi:hypothetical protein